MVPERLALKRPEFPASWRSPEAPGYGTYPGPYDYVDDLIEQYARTVGDALSCGYRHIDTAQTYSNEALIGNALQETPLKREEYFVTSKLHPESNSLHDAVRGVESSLDKLKIDYLDLFLLHYPGEGDPVGAWRGLLEAKAKGLTRLVGVSNCEIRHLEVIEELTGERAQVNQIEFHPYLYSESLATLVKYCRGKDIQVEAYCPLAWGNKYGLLRNPLIRRIAQKYRVPSARVVLKWCKQHEVRPIVGSLNPDHIRENFGPYDFVLSSREMKEMDDLRLRIAPLEWTWDPPSVTTDGWM